MRPALETRTVLTKRRGICCKHLRCYFRNLRILKTSKSFLLSKVSSFTTSHMVRQLLTCLQLVNFLKSNMSSSLISARPIPVHLNDSHFSLSTSTWGLESPSASSFAKATQLKSLPQTSPRSTYSIKKCTSS
jgi:hypothetical protein